VCRLFRSVPDSAPEQVTTIREKPPDVTLATNGDYLAVFGERLLVLSLPDCKTVFEKTRDPTLLQALVGTMSSSYLYVQGLQAGVISELSLPTGEVLRSFEGPASAAVYMMAQGDFLYAAGWIARGAKFIHLGSGEAQLAERFNEECPAVAAAIDRTGTLLTVPRSTFQCWRLPAPADWKPAFKVSSPGMPRGFECWAAAVSQRVTCFGCHDFHGNDFRLVWLPVFRQDE